MGRKKKKSDDGSGAPNPDAWLPTYSDCMTLCLCFFAVLYNPEAGSSERVQAVAQAMLPIQNLNPTKGGMSVSPGAMPSMGNNVMSLPSNSRGDSLGTALKRATSLFTPEVKSSIITVTQDERGIVISLASDAFFEQGSATLNLDASRDILLRLGTLLASPEVAGRKFRIEGHTDDRPVEPSGPWESNWELSTARSISVLDYLLGLGIPESRFQVAGFADTMPLASNDTREGQAYNRRVDVVIIDDAHL
jgi:chemotaxis protein MotB